MEIIRHELVDPPGRPCISRVVGYGDTVYVCGVTPETSGDIKSQTREVLNQIDRHLDTAGTDKSKLLSAQVWLTNIRLRPGLLAEIMVTAAK